MVLSGVIQFQVGLLLLCVVAVIYISFTAYEIDFKNLNDVFFFKPSSPSCVFDRKTTESYPTISYPVKTKQDWPSDQNVNMTISHEFFQYLAGQLRGTPFPGVDNYTQYTVAHAKLKPLPNAKPLRPEFGPVYNDVFYFNYPIEIRPCRNITGGLFVAVISAPDYFDKRQVIRQTWLRHMSNQSDELNLSGFGFIVGLTKNNDIQVRIEEESKTFGDILQIDMMDDYYNLTLKVVALTNWINDRCSKVDFVLKVDDDVYVNVHNLLGVLKTLNSTELSVYGSVTDGPPQRDGKWDISFEDWPWGQYPRYFRGAAVLLPGITIGPLLAASQTTPYFPFDDTYLTGLCTDKAGIKVVHSPSVFVGWAADIPEPCTVFYSVTWLTGSVEHLNQSHWATENFYKKETQCVVTESDGTNRTVDPNEFYFAK